MNSDFFTNLRMSVQDWPHWDSLVNKGIELSVNLLAALAILLIGKWVAARIVRLMQIGMQRAKVDPTLIGFLGNVASVALLVMVVMAALGRLGVPTTSAAALIGGAGLAIGLSLKDQLANFAAGTLIIFFRPFRVGDYIKVGSFEGYVREIRIVQTSLRTYANEEVILPNSMVMSDSVINRSSLPLWRSQVVVGVDYACDLKVAKAAVLRAATEHPKCVNAERAPSVQITSLGDNAIELTLWAWSTEADWWSVQCDLYEAVVENLRAVNISIPFPQRDLHIINPPAPLAAARQP